MRARYQPTALFPTLQAKSALAALNSILFLFLVLVLILKETTTTTTKKHPGKNECLVFSLAARQNADQCSALKKHTYTRRHQERQTLPEMASSSSAAAEQANSRWTWKSGVEQAWAKTNIAVVDIADIWERSVDG